MTQMVSVYDYLLSENWVVTLTGNEFQKDGVPLTEKVTDFYRKHYNAEVQREGLGRVVLNERGVKDSLAHGVSRQKCAAFAAVPDIIKYGIIVEQQENWKNRGYQSFTIAAPIKINADGFVGIVIVTQKDDSFRFYLHVTLPQKSLRSSFKTSLAGMPPGDTAKVLLNLDTTSGYNKKIDSLPTSTNRNKSQYGSTASSELEKL
jgi:hypothetical protein